jgi:hypothetical protein
MKKFTFTEEELITRAFERLSRILYEQWQEGGGGDSKNGDTRLFDWLIDDKYVLIGESKKGNNWREHLVPRVVIRDICCDEFKLGKTYEEVAETIRTLLKIARISIEEREYIDHELGLKTEMPKDWDYTTGDYMRRLRDGNVELVSQSN